MATVELLLSRVSDRNDRLPITIEVLESSVAKRWLQLLKEIIALRLTMKKDFCFLGFPEAPEGLSFWCDKLNSYVEEINRFRAPGAWENGYQIGQRFRAEDIFHDGKYDPRPMFEIHHHFELLQGQDWNVSQFFVQADVRLKYIIGQLNYMCHQIEALGRSLEARERGAEFVSPNTTFSTLWVVKAPLLGEDLSHFALSPGNFGDVYLKYAQLGKTHWDAFIEGDTEIFASNLSGMRYLSGQFWIAWGAGEAEEEFQRKKEQFFGWLRENNCDPRDPQLALGQLKVGQVRRSDFGSKSLPEIHHLLSGYLNIEAITVREGNQEVTGRYPYHFTDPGYDAHQASRLSQECELATAANAFRGVFLKAAATGRESPAAQKQKLNHRRRK